jgi:hypothetical protein
VCPRSVLYSGSPHQEKGRDPTQSSHNKDIPLFGSNMGGGKCIHSTCFFLGGRIRSAASKNLSALFMRGARVPHTPILDQDRINSI